MIKNNRFLQILLRQNREYSSGLNSTRLIRETPHFLRTHFKWTNIKLLFLLFSFFIIYLIIRRIFPTFGITSPSTDSSRIIRTKFNAFIITENCESSRFLTTKSNIERAFPEFFTIICHPYVPLTDPRIHITTIDQLKIKSSNLLSFLDIWVKEIPKRSNSDEYQWSFIFEDDVNFINASSINLPNFIEPLRELMFNPDIREKDGFFYLGICSPNFGNDTQMLFSNATHGQLISRRACGYCRHATAITSQRAELFWTEVSSYRPDIENSIDFHLNNYCLRSGNRFYTFGMNFSSPIDPISTGIAYQEHKR